VRTLPLLEPSSPGNSIYIYATKSTTKQQLSSILLHIMRLLSLRDNDIPLHSNNRQYNSRSSPELRMNNTTTRINNKKNDWSRSRISIGHTPVVKRPERITPEPKGITVKKLIPSIPLNTISDYPNVKDHRLYALLGYECSCMNCKSLDNVHVITFEKCKGSANVAFHILYHLVCDCGWERESSSSVVVGK
jgi:hypothetical protein